MDIGLKGIRQALSGNSAPDERLKIAIAYSIDGMTDQRGATAVLLNEGAVSPRRHRQIIARRDDYERMLRRIIEEGIAAGVFVPCDPTLVGFGILGAMNWIPKWYDASGQCSAMDECPIPRDYRDIRVATIGDGTSQIQKRVIVRKLGLGKVHDGSLDQGAGSY